MIEALLSALKAVEGLYQAPLLSHQVPTKRPEQKFSDVKYQAFMESY